MTNRKISGTIKQVQRMRKAPVNRKVAAGTQGIIHAHNMVSGPFRFETDQIFHFGDRVDFELTPDGEVVNIQKRKRPTRISE